MPDDADEAGWRTLLVNTEIMTDEGVTVGESSCLAQAQTVFFHMLALMRWRFQETRKTTPLGNGQRSVVP